MPHRTDPIRTWAVVATGGLLAACSLWQPPPAPPPVAPPPPLPAPVPPPPPAPPPAPQVDPSDAAARKLLAYHEQLRQWSPAELGQELTRLNAFVAANASSAPPSLVLELSLALAHTRNNGDLARAVALLDPIVKSGNPELLPWQPLARLLQGRFAEQRRLEEQLERVNAQLRESQRNLQQTNDKLEALKAIERSLTPRPTTVPAAAPPRSAPSASAPPKAP